MLLACRYLEFIVGLPVVAVKFGTRCDMHSGCLAPPVAYPSNVAAVRRRATCKQPAQKCGPEEGAVLSWQDRAGRGYAGAWWMRGGWGRQGCRRSQSGWLGRRGRFRDGVDGIPVAVRSRLPEGAREPDPFEDLPDLVAHGPPGLGGEAVRVPGDRQLPELIEADQGTLFQVARAAPAIDVLFRPEEEHGASGVGEVVPPVSRGHREVRDAGRRHGGVVLDTERHRLPAASAARPDGGIRVERGRDAVCVPDAVGEIRPLVRGDLEGRGGRGERRGHDDLAVVRSQVEQAAGPQALKTLEHVGRGNAEGGRYLRGEGRPAELDGRGVDVVAELLVGQHGLIVHQRSSKITGKALAGSAESRLAVQRSAWASQDFGRASGSLAGPAKAPPVQRSSGWAGEPLAGPSRALSGPARLSMGPAELWQGCQSFERRCKPLAGVAEVWLGRPKVCQPVAELCTSCGGSARDPESGESEAEAPGRLRTLRGR
jgi:hypothetical protein